MADVLSIIFILLLASYFVFIRNIRIGLTKLGYYKTQAQLDEFISVIIPFRNESEKIVENLKGLELQNYPDDKYEVIYINDFSEDKSLEKLQNGITKSNVKVYSMEEGGFTKAHKKEAIELKDALLFVPYGKKYYQFIIDQIKERINNIVNG